MTSLQKAITTATGTIQSLIDLEPQLDRAEKMIERSLTGGSQLLVCGNGGSAADAADFATEFACRFIGDRRPYPALNLSACGSLVTAIGNDYGFDEVFARQVRGFGKKGDTLVAISTSGNSTSIVRALEEARRSGIESIALLGKGGGHAKGLATVELVVASDITARIQEAHKFLLHVICESVEPALARA